MESKASGQLQSPTGSANAGDEGEGVYNSKKKLAFIDLLIEHHLRDPTSLSEIDIREEVDTFMFEGHDTTTMSLIWTTYLVGKHPEVQDKIQAELDDVFPDEESIRYLTTENIRKLKYLEACIKESLRLFPSVPFIGRITSEDLVCADQVIPKDTTLILMLFNMHRSPNYYVKPDHFIPERFLDADSSLKIKSPYAYVPFSAGPRNCIGQKFALQEEKVILAKVFKHFCVHSTQDVDKLQIVPELVIRPKHSINVQFSRRTFAEQ